MLEGGGSPTPTPPVLHSWRADFLCSIQVTGAFLERSPSSRYHLGALCFTPRAQRHSPNNNSVAPIP